MLWGRTITMKENSSGKLRTIYKAEDVFSGMKTPIVNDLQVILCLISRFAFSFNYEINMGF